MQNVEAIANFLAAEHRSEDASIEAIYWLRHGTEVRLIEVTKSVLSPLLTLDW